MGEEFVEAAGCRPVLISESGCGGGAGPGAAAGAGMWAFLAMAQVKLTRAGEIEAGLNAILDAERAKSQQWCIRYEYALSTPVTVGGGDDGVDEAIDTVFLPLPAVSPTAAAGCSCQHRPETNQQANPPTQHASPTLPGDARARPRRK